MSLPSKRGCGRTDRSAELRLQTKFSLNACLMEDVCGRAAGLRDRGAKQDASCRRVLQEGDDELAMGIERRSPAHQRHDAVGSRELEQLIDVGIGETLRDAAQDQLPAQLRTEAFAPSRLVTSQSVCVKGVAGQPLRKRLCSQVAAEQAVVDPSAGRRLHET